MNIFKQHWLKLLTIPLVVTLLFHLLPSLYYCSSGYQYVFDKKTSFSTGSFEPRFTLKRGYKESHFFITQYKYYLAPHSLKLPISYAINATTQNDFSSATLNTFDVVYENGELKSLLKGKPIALEEDSNRLKAKSILFENVIPHDMSFKIIMKGYSVNTIGEQQPFHMESSYRLKYSDEQRCYNLIDLINSV